MIEQSLDKYLTDCSLLEMSDEDLEKLLILIIKVLDQSDIEECEILLENIKSKSGKTENWEIAFKRTSQNNHVHK